MNNPIEINFSFYDEIYRARFIKDNYVNNGNLYVGVLTWNDDYDDWEEWGDLTTNLPSTRLEYNEAFLDTNNCTPEIIIALENNGYIKDTRLKRQSGFCTYPLYEFTEEFLNGTLQ